MKTISTCWVIIALALAIPVGQATARPSLDYSQGVRSENADTVKAPELVITSQPAEAQVFIDGKEAGPTPLTVQDAGEGLHHVVLLKEGYLSAADTVTLVPGSVTVRQYSLRQPGKLSVTSVPDSARVFVGDSLYGITPLEISDLPPGSFLLTVTRHLYLRWEQTIRISEGRQTDVVAKLVPGTGHLTLQVAPQNAEVFIDGKLVGVGGVDNLELTAGKYSILLVTPGVGDSLAKDLFIPGGAHLRLGAKINQLTVSPIVMSAIVPGLGQITTGEVFEGVAYLAGFAAAVAFTLNADQTYHDKQTSYDQLYARYKAQTIESGATQYSDQVTTAYDEASRAYTIRNLGIVATLLVYAGSMVDVILNHSHSSEIESLANVWGGTVRPDLALAPGRVRFGIRIGL